MPGRPASTPLRRALASSVLLVFGLVTLTGCFTAKIELNVATDDTVTGDAVIAVDRDVVERSGSVDDVIGDLVDKVLPSDPPSGSVTTEPYEDSKRVGVQVVLVDVGLDAFGAVSDARPASLKITRDGDRFVVVGEVHLTADELDVADDPQAQRLLADATVSVQLTFPGPVLATNGQVSGSGAGGGNTVTWSLPMGETTAMNATAKATPVSNPLVSTAGTLVVIASVLVALIIAALVLALLVWRRRRGRVRRRGRHAAGASDG